MVMFEEDARESTSGQRILEIDYKGMCSIVLSCLRDSNRGW